MVREIAVSELTENLAQMCIKANHVLSGDMDRALKCAVETEESPLGTKILKQLQENLQIADEERIPICQDTGMAVVFLEVGQDVHFVGGSVEDAVNEGVRKGYEEGYLRKSVVRDPIDRVNTKDNTPAVIHYSIVPGDQVKMTFAPKGFGSENMSRIFMLKPADGLEGVTEESPLGTKILKQLQENLQIADEERIPICQDTGMAVVFLEVGQDVHFVGGSVEDAVNEGVRKGYEEGYLRKSVVRDPIDRVNTKDNTPAVIHYSIVPGDQVKMTFAPKGFGSENMSRIFMLKPADGLEGVKEAILTAVRDAGPNACPPMVVGVGIGGTFEKCALLAKQALTRNVEEHAKIPYVRELEIEMLEKINELGIGPAGLGGTTTALAVNINTYPTHIAGLPVAVNICCHVNRHVTRIL